MTQTCSWHILSPITNLIPANKSTLTYAKNLHLLFSNIAFSATHNSVQLYLAMNRTHSHTNLQTDPWNTQYWMFWHNKHLLMYVRFRTKRLTISPCCFCCRFLQTSRRNPGKHQFPKASVLSKLNTLALNLDLMVSNQQRKKYNGKRKTPEANLRKASDELWRVSRGLYL